MGKSIPAACLDPTRHYRTRACYPRLNVGLIASRAGDVRINPFETEATRRLANGKRAPAISLSRNHLYARVQRELVD